MPTIPKGSGQKMREHTAVEKTWMKKVKWFLSKHNGKQGKPSQRQKTTNAYNLYNIPYGEPKVQNHSWYLLNYPVEINFQNSIHWIRVERTQRRVQPRTRVPNFSRLRTQTLHLRVSKFWTHNKFLYLADRYGEPCHILWWQKQLTFFSGTARGYFLHALFFAKCCSNQKMNLTSQWILFFVLFFLEFSWENRQLHQLAQREMNQDMIKWKVQCIAIVRWNKSSWEI